MAEFRFNGLSAGGQSVQGTVYAPNKRTAQKKVATLAQQHTFTLNDLEERMLFNYKVKHPTGKILKGEQKAYGPDEIRTALERMGLEVLSIKKNLLNFQRTPPTGDIIMFVRLASNLLMEKMPFSEVMNLLMADISSPPLKHVLRDINSDLKGGMEAKQAFMKHQDKLGKFTAYMLGIASQSGNMAEIYEATARFLERQNEFKRSVRSAMITPAVTLVVLIGVMIWYVWSIFPQTAGLLAEFNMELPPLTKRTLAFSEWMDRNWWWSLGIVVTLVGSALAWLRTPKGRHWKDRNLIRLPFIGALLHKLNVEIYCRVFAVLYSGAGDNISVIKIAAEACGNAYMEHRIRTITVPMMVAQGAELVRAMEASGVFTSMAVARFRSGSETGNVRAAAQQMADYYEKETTLKLKSTVETIQTGVAIVITLAIIFLTLVSSEIALVQPSAQDLMQANQ